MSPVLALRDRSASSTDSFPLPQPWYLPKDHESGANTDTGAPRGRLLRLPRATQSSSTVQARGELDAVWSAVRSEFIAAPAERFEDGMESRFSLALAGLVRRSGVTAVAAAGKLIKRAFPTIQVAGEALRTLGRVRDRSSEGLRSALIRRSFADQSLAMRDAALIALAYLDDPRYADFLRDAAAIEVNPSLRRDMENQLHEWE
jgi:hypothetical protein